MSDPVVRRRKITDYKNDPKNANKGTERGWRMLCAAIDVFERTIYSKGGESHSLRHYTSYNENIEGGR